MKFILAVVYIHPDIQTFFAQSLLPYAFSTNSDRTPMLLMGDFNVDDRNRSKLSEYLLTHFKLYIFKTI